MAGIRGLNKFRDKYGFVAADDVSRAGDADDCQRVQESGAGEAFVGHARFRRFSHFDHIGAVSQAGGALHGAAASVDPILLPGARAAALHELPESERLTVYVAAVSSNQFQGTTMEDLFTALEKHRL
jgi:hypothetical protein